MGFAADAILCSKGDGVGKRIVQLDGVRTLAISAVFLHHALKIKMLWAGVDLFFILSGFLITGILIDHKHQDLGAYFTGFSRSARGESFRPTCCYWL